ncbi:MAG: hypothetical protein ACLFOY_11535 [Desulfatibacillaceae bacterium]
MDLLVDILNASRTWLLPAGLGAALILLAYEVVNTARELFPAPVPVKVDKERRG